MSQNEENVSRIEEWSSGPKAAERSSEVSSEDCPFVLGIWPLFLSTGCPVYLERSFSLFVLEAY